MREGIAILTGVLNGLAVWALFGWLFSRGLKEPAAAGGGLRPGKKYAALFTVFLVLALISDVSMFFLLHQ